MTVDYFAITPFIVVFHVTNPMRRLFLLHHNKVIFNLTVQIETCRKNGKMERERELCYKNFILENRDFQSWF